MNQSTSPHSLYNRQDYSERSDRTIFGLNAPLRIEILKIYHLKGSFYIEIREMYRLEGSLENFRVHLELFLNGTFH